MLMHYEYMWMEAGRAEGSIKKLLVFGKVRVA